MKKGNDISLFEFSAFDVFVLPETDPDIIDLNMLDQNRNLVIYSNENDNPELEVFLNNIFVAINPEPEKNFLFLKVTAQTRYSFYRIKEKIGAKDLISFGIPLSGFGMHHVVPAYQPIIIDNSLRILLADSLDKIKSDVKKKKALWGCLKTLYLSS